MVARLTLNQEAPGQYRAPVPLRAGRFVRPASFKKEEIMTVEQLSNILSVLPPENEILIEYQPRAHEWVTEAVLGVRTNDSNTIILGVTEVM